MCNLNNNQMDKTDKQTSILNVTIQDTKYRVEGNATYCDMVIKVNLNAFEQKFHQFTPNFVKKVIGEHLPVVKTILNYGYSDLEPVVAKYYMIPGGPAKVLAFNKKYYKRYHNFTNDQLVEVGDIIPVKEIVKACGECVQYDYCQTFVVTGKAICLPDDQFDDEKGKALASQKAIAKGAKRINRLYGAILGKTTKMVDEIQAQYNITFDWVKQVDKIEATLNSADTDKSE